MAGESLSDPDGFLKAVISIGLLLFSIIITLTLIFENQTALSEKVHPALAFCCIVLALLWLALVEGGQASLVGLPPIEKSLYRFSHPISYKICSLAHAGDNLDRYLAGRQFMVLLLVFTINQAGAAIDTKHEFLGLPPFLSEVFLQSGFALMLITCIVGQLNTQVNASHCMLDFINDWGNWFTVKVAMAIEASGILHASYLLQLAVGWMAGKPIASNEPPRTYWQAFLFWGRVAMSCAIVVFSFRVTGVALFEGKTTMWNRVSPLASVFIFIVLTAIVGLLEGMQIAYFAVSRMTEEQRNCGVWAIRTCELLFGCEGHNLPGFIVGRQLSVVSCFFVLARITSMDIKDGQSNVLGVSDGVQEFFNTGLLGALITTVVSSIVWQLLASAFPLAFMSNPVSYGLLRACLFLESTGICSAAFLIATAHRAICRFHRDEVYVGTAEERDAMKHAGNTSSSGGDLSQVYQPPPQGGVGHFTGGVLFPPRQEDHLTAQERRAQILMMVELLKRQVSLAGTEEERSLHKAALQYQMAALQHVDRELARASTSRLSRRPRDATDSTLEVICESPTSVCEESSEAPPDVLLDEEDVV